MTLSLCFTVFVLFLGGSTTHLAVLLRLSIFFWDVRDVIHPSRVQTCCIFKGMMMTAIAKKLVTMVKV